MKRAIAASFMFLMSCACTGEYRGNTSRTDVAGFDNGDIIEFDHGGYHYVVWDGANGGVLLDKQQIK